MRNSGDQIVVDLISPARDISIGFFALGTEHGEIFDHARTSLIEILGLGQASKRDIHCWSPHRMWSGCRGSSPKTRRAAVDCDRNVYHGLTTFQRAILERLMRDGVLLVAVADPGSSRNACPGL